MYKRKKFSLMVSPEKKVGGASKPFRFSHIHIKETLTITINSVEGCSVIKLVKDQTVGKREILTNKILRMPFLFAYS